ncbi:MAG: carbohydrate ABC transporter permease, partial [Anaerolineae bacterium]|nr:carbohydrate ABC transporter permease [Anaerolineae bacterium]
MRFQIDKSHTAAYIVIGVMLLFNLLPFFWMVSTSLKTEAESYAIPPTYWPKTITFEAYNQVLQWSNFPRQFFNSTVISLATAVFSTFLGAMAGYGFSRYHFIGKTTLIGLVLATQMLPGVLLVGPYFRIMSSIGLHNTYAGLILAFTTITLPFSIWMLKGFTDTVPRELDEAAMVDGCTPLGAYIRVILPLLAPGMV